MRSTFHLVTTLGWDFPFHPKSSTSCPNTSWHDPTGPRPYSPYVQTPLWHIIWSRDPIVPFLWKLYGTDILTPPPLYMSSDTLCYTERKTAAYLEKSSSLTAYISSYLCGALWAFSKLLQHLATIPSRAVCVRGHPGPCKTVLVPKDSGQSRNSGRPCIIIHTQDYIFHPWVYGAESAR